MRNWITTALVTAIAIIGISATSYAVGTENSWSLKLTISTSNSSDLLPITIGEGQAADELLKPPPLPGMSITGSTNLEDAVVDSYVITSAEREGAARSISVADSDAPAKVWAIHVDTEDIGSELSLEIDASEHYSKYDVAIVDVTNQTIKEFGNYDTSNKETQKIIDSAASSQVLYAVVGESLTFSILDGGTMYGAARLTASAVENKREEGVEVKLLDSSCNQVGTTATTNANGFFTIPSISATGKHYLHFDKKYAIGSECEINITGTDKDTAACRDVFVGDVKEDGKINASDLFLMRPYYNQALTGEEGEEVTKLDINGDLRVNASDIFVIKPAYLNDDIKEVASESNPCGGSF